MKFVLIFMMSVLFVITHQYFPDQQPREMPWLSPHPTINKYQHPFIFYYPKPQIMPEIYSSHDFAWENPQRNADLFYAENMDSVADNTQRNLAELPNFADVQSRGKVSLLPEKVDPRFFFGTSATITNPFFKTATFTVSSTLTLSSVVKCIVSGDFANIAAQATPCRRKRGFPEEQEKSEDQQSDVFSPSQPQMMIMSTTLPSFDVMQENRQLLSDQKQIENHEIISSKENVLPQSIGATLGGNLKKKRFLFFNNNPYVVSKTVTSFSFVSKTSTVTVDVAIDVGLNCLPTGYVVC